MQSLCKVFCLDYTSNGIQDDIEEWWAVPSDFNLLELNKRKWNDTHNYVGLKSNQQVGVIGENNLSSIKG